jgi:hypothetical protein
MQTSFFVIHTTSMMVSALVPGVVCRIFVIVVELPLDYICGWLFKKNIPVSL